jgi:long-chain acyl-CoA synthetase
MLVPVNGGPAPASGGQAFEPITYAQLWDLVRGYAGAIRELGLQPGDRLAIQSENCYQWALVDWASLCLGVTVVPIYPTLPADQSQYILMDSGAKVYVAGTTQQAAKVGPDSSVAVVPLIDGPESVAARAQGAALPDDELEAIIDRVEPQTLATIIYTSGTTGPPKGVMLPHRAPAWVCQRVRDYLPVDERDRFLSFLPMSHAFERIGGQFVPISLGASIGYSRGLAALATDIQLVKPTIVLCVPRLLEAVRTRISLSVNKEALPPHTVSRGSRWRQAIFNLTLTQGRRRARGQPAPLAWPLSRLVGARVRDRLGGRLRFFVAGGAVLEPEVAEFFDALGLPVLQGYGLTETAAATTLNHPDRNRHGTVGQPIPGVDVKLADDGEICVRGPSLMAGYYNRQEDTRQVIDTEGWFHTGDLGQWDDGHLRFIDRKKDLLVLSNGKNVAPQPIESRLRECPFISEAVLFGDNLPHVVALIVPDFGRLREHLGLPGAEPVSNAELVGRDDVRQLIKADVGKTNETLADFERIRRHCLVHAEFGIETGELTPTLKVRRKVILEKYGHLIGELFR